MTLPHPLLPYVTPDIYEPWMDAWRFQQERKLWYHVMSFQAGYGVFSKVEDLGTKLDAYQRVAWKGIGARGIRKIEQHERVTKHDVKARIEAFNDEASYAYYYRETVSGRRRPGWPEPRLELAHVGMTSADVVDNVSLIQMAASTRALRQTPRAETDDRRYHTLTTLLNVIPFRGIKGPVGTQQDMLDVFQGNTTAVDMLEKHLAEAFGVRGGVLNSTGQVYPRSIDLMIATYLGAVVHDLGKQPWRTIFNGYFGMIMSYSGDQWNEGDVSTSVTRRVALPGVFMATGAALLDKDPPDA